RCDSRLKRTAAPPPPVTPSTSSGPPVSILHRASEILGTALMPEGPNSGYLVVKGANEDAEDLKWSRWRPVEDLAFP
ncbi:hypothetical protein EJB05_49266, partial [Eragrostis curvula]